MREDEARSRPFARGLRQHLTKPEAILWRMLKGRRMAGARFRRQHPIGPFVADFACVELALVIEVDGASHDGSDQRRHDVMRTARLTGLGWQVVRIRNEDVLRNLEGVWATVQMAVRAQRETARADIPPPSLRDTFPASGGGCSSRRAGTGPLTPRRGCDPRP